MKDHNRFSYSRFKTMQLCPRKHYYAYIEQIKTKHKASPLIVGDLFHKALAKMSFNEDYSDILKEYNNLVTSGQIEGQIDLLEYVLSLYKKHYEEESDRERILMIEQHIIDKINKHHYLEAVIDKVVEDEETGLIILRDTKTTSSSLKYTYNDVAYNQQLLFYVPFVEKELGIEIDAIQIDEVRIARLSSVPINKNGKPSTDKGRNELVTYEDYYNTLKVMKLDKAPEYQSILQYLEKRGHPLFNRTTAQLIDRNYVDSTIQDMNDLYKLCANKDFKPRNKGFLCNQCEYSLLCKLDYCNPSDYDREYCINKL